MRKTLLVLFAIYSTINLTYGQSIPSPHWAILSDNCEIAVSKGSIQDVSQYIAKEREHLQMETLSNIQQFIDVNTKSAAFGAKETVLIIDSLDSNTFYAVDPIGRFLYIRGSLINAQYSQSKATPGVGLLNQDFTLESGRKMRAGLFLWVFEIESENEKAIVQLADNDFVKIPLSKMSMLRSRYSDVPDSWQFKDVLK